MTSTTYSNYSTAGALTHGAVSSYNYIDLKYTSSIRFDAFLHELGHALDRYYSSSHGERISSKKEVSDLYNMIKGSRGLTTQSINEFFADTFVDYYNHVIMNKNTKYYLTENDTDKLTQNELNALKNVLKKYL